MEAVARQLDEVDGVARVRVVDATRRGHAVLSAGVRPSAVDTTLDEVRRLGVADADITLTRVELVGSLATGRADAGLVWADIIGSALLNARPIARYLAFMVAAGVIASYGVIEDSAILIVGAMAVSPDLLPITAIGVGIVARRPLLAGRALLTLAVGLGVATTAAALSALAQDRLRPPSIRLRHRGDRDARKPHVRERRDDRGGPGRGRGGDAGARDPSELRGRCGDLGDDDPRSRLSRRCRRHRRGRSSRGRSRRARRERLDDGRRCGGHPCASERAQPPRGRQTAAEARHASGSRRRRVTAESS